MLMVYQAVTLLVFPFVYIYLQVRKIRGKEDKIRFGERFGKTTFVRPEGKLLWVHAASVGESLSIVPLVKRLLDERPQLHILVTTVTVNSANMMATRLPDRAFHQYVPVDNKVFVTRFLKYWKPDMALWVESELWPCLLQAVSRQCPLLLINARMSDRSFKKWSRVPWFSRAMLQTFSQVLAQSKIDEERYKKLGTAQVTCSGNLKYDTPALAADMDEVEHIRSDIQGRPVLLAASTHHDEELRLSNIHLALKKGYPDLLTIIVPRHPKRKEEIVASLASNISVVCRSDQEKITPHTDIYLADTMGELGIFYRIASIVFIGGTLVAHGGQNPLEPARLHCTILFGPHMENFREIEHEFLENKAAIKVSNEEKLIETLKALLADESQCRTLADAAKALVTSKNGVIDRVVDKINAYQVL